MSYFVYQTTFEINNISLYEYFHHNILIDTAKMRHINDTLPHQTTV